MLKPLGDRIIIEVGQQEEVTSGGLVLPAGSKEKPQTGSVISVGEGRILDNGTKLPLSVKVGDQVMFEKYSGSEVKYEGNEYLIVHEKDIVAIIE